MDATAEAADDTAERKLELRTSAASAAIQDGSYRDALLRARDAAASRGDFKRVREANEFLEELGLPDQRFRNWYAVVCGPLLVLSGLLYGWKGLPGAGLVAPALMLSGLWLVLKVCGVSSADLRELVRRPKPDQE